MNRAFTTTEYKEEVVSTHDPAIQALGEGIARTVIKEKGIAQAAAILSLALYEVFFLILHSESPFPERNVESISTLIESLKTNTLAHVDCALHLTAAKLAQQADEPLIEPKTPTVH